MVSQLESFGKKFRLNGLIFAVLMIIGLGIVLFPIVWMVLASVRPVSETFGTPPAWIPREVNFEAYQTIFFDPRQQRYQVNTWFIALSTAFLSVGLGSLAAYGFSRFKIRGGQVYPAGYFGFTNVAGSLHHHPLLQHGPLGRYLGYLPGHDSSRYGLCPGHFNLAAKRLCRQYPPRFGRSSHGGWL